MRIYWIIEKLFMMGKDEDYVLSQGYSREEIEQAKEIYYNGERLTIRMRRESEGIHHD
tara:strand:+ start:340 stop:513 length:174 start_codon:yes stop_codon:yes gene_type:complete